MITFDTLIQNVSKLIDGEKESDGTWIERMEEVSRKLEVLEISIDSDKGATVEEMTAMGDVFIALLVLCKQRGYQADTCLNMAYNKVRKGVIEKRESEAKKK